MAEPVDLVRQAADDSVARRRVALAVVATLSVLAVLNLAVLAFVANLMWADHQDRRDSQKQGERIVGDLYASINRTDARLAELTGKPTPPTVAPPQRTTRTSSATVATTAPTTAVRPSQPPTSSTTTTTVPKPATTTTATTARPTTTTTCATVDGVGICRASRSGARTTLDWAALRRCESGNRYDADTGNGHYGAYQYLLSTWRSVGGAGNPARASPDEQDYRAALLFRRSGRRPWPYCGQFL